MGMANNRNLIVIPCHRIVGANGSTVGYGGGLPLKAALLELEKKARGRNFQNFSAEFFYPGYLTFSAECPIICKAMRV